MSFNFSAFWSKISSAASKTVSVLSKAASKVSAKLTKMFPRAFPALVKFFARFPLFLKVALVIAIVAGLILLTLHYYHESGWTPTEGGSGAGSGSGEISGNGEPTPLNDSIPWDNLKNGDEYCITKKNGEPLMTLSAVLPGTFYFGLLNPANKKYAEETFGDKYPLVTLTMPFFIGQTEVTLDQYKYVMEIWNKKHPKLAVKLTPGLELKERLKPGADHDNVPVDQVSWNEAMYFCKALEESGLLPPGTKCTLPTEMQFEFAARGGTKESDKYFKYAGSNNKNEVDPDGYNVAYSGKPNGLKIYGMSNSYWEWCLDDFNYDVEKLKSEFSRSHLDISIELRSLRGVGEVSNRRAAYRSNMFGAAETKFNMGVPGVGFRVILIPDRPINAKEITIYKPAPVEDSKPPVITPIYPENNQIIRYANPEIRVGVTDAGDTESAEASGVEKVVIKVDGKIMQSHYHIGLKSSSGKLHPRENTEYKALKDGEHTIDVTAEDKAGNKSAASWKFKVDTTPPEYSNFAPAKNAVVTDEEITISVTVTDKLSGVEPQWLGLRVDGTLQDISFDEKTGRASFSTKKLKPGKYKVSVSANDKVGNNSSTSWEFTVKDKTPPEIIPRSPKPSSFIKVKNPRISAEIIDNQSGVDPDSIRISAAGQRLSAKYSGGSHSATAQMSPMNDGVYTASVSAKDKAGNQGSASWEFTIDTTPPEFHNLNPARNAELRNGNVQISVSITDKLSGVDKKSIVIRLDGKNVTHQSTSSGNTVKINAGTLSKGRHRVNISAKDNAGNSGSISWNFTIKDAPAQDSSVDNMPPVITDFVPEKDAEVLPGKIKIGATVKDRDSGIAANTIVLKLNGETVRHRFSSSSGKVSFDVKQLKLGTNKIYIYVEDKVGNSASANWSFEVKDSNFSAQDDYFLLKVGSSTLKMPLMKPNNFTIGKEINQQGNIYNDPQTAHERDVKVQFYIGETEISQAMYKEVITRWNAQNPTRKLNAQPSKGIEANYAVTNVSWQEAMIFCEYLNKNNFAPQGYYFSLPTEILWEFAARSCNSKSDQNKYYLYSGGNDPDRFVNYKGNCQKQPEIKKQRSNAMQIFDMSGGVMEWCLDDRQNNSKRLRTVYQRRATRSSRPSQTRGGSWRTDLKYCHVISRPPEMAFDKNTRRDDLGFRIVLVKK